MLFLSVGLLCAWGVCRLSSVVIDLVLVIVSLRDESLLSLSDCWRSDKFVNLFFVLLEDFDFVLQFVHTARQYLYHQN